MSDSPRRSTPTWLLLAISAAVAAVTVVSATRSVLTAAGWREVDDEELTRAALAGLFGEQQVRSAELFVSLVTVPVAVAATLLLLGLLTWRSWAREAVLGVYGLVGALLVVFSAAGLAGEARNAGVGLVVGVLLLAVAALAVSPPVAGDFDRKRIADEVRERKRREQERRRSQSR